MPVFKVDKPFILSAASLRPVLDAVKMSDEFAAGYRRSAGATVLTCDVTMPRPSKRGYPYGRVAGFSYQGAIEMQYDREKSKLRVDIYEDPQPSDEVVDSLKTALRENGFDHGEDIFRVRDAFLFSYDDNYKTPVLDLPFELTRDTAKAFADYAYRCAHSLKRYPRDFTFPDGSVPAFDFKFENTNDGPRFVIGGAGNGNVISGTMKLHEICVFPDSTPVDVQLKDLTVACDIKTPEIGMPDEKAFKFLRPMGEHFFMQFLCHNLFGFDLYSTGPKVEQMRAEWLKADLKKRMPRPGYMPAQRKKMPDFFDQHNLMLRVREWWNGEFIDN